MVATGGFSGVVVVVVAFGVVAAAAASSSEISIKDVGELDLIWIVLLCLCFCLCLGLAWGISAGNDNGGESDRDMKEGASNVGLTILRKDTSSGERGIECRRGLDKLNAAAPRRRCLPAK